MFVVMLTILNSGIRHPIKSFIMKIYCMNIKDNKNHKTRNTSAPDAIALSSPKKNFELQIVYIKSLTQVMMGYTIEFHQVRHFRIIGRN